MTRNPRQASIPGTEPDTDEAIDEAIIDLRDARDTLKAAQERVRKAEATLVTRMMSSEVARYDYVDGAGGGWVAALDLPAPVVRLKYLGSRHEGDDADHR